MTLLSIVHRLIEGVYGTSPGTPDPAGHVIGDRGLERIQARFRVVRSVEDLPDTAIDSGPRVLLRETAAGMALSIYYPDRLIERLEQRPPSQLLDAGNVDDFAAFIEELDHFVALAEGIRLSREISLLELETRANVSKALVLAHFISRLTDRPRLGPGDRVFIRYHLFEKTVVDEAQQAIRRRYRDAGRFAVRLLDRLEGLPARMRLPELRRWNALPAVLKIRELSAA